MLGEIASIQGFDEETAAEIQNRATDYLAAIERHNDEERKTLGVEDELYDIPGLTAAMLVALGKEGIKTIEDFAGCAADDLVGWTERKDGEIKRFDGTFKDFPVSREEAEDMIMQARLKAGWITEADLAPPVRRRRSGRRSTRVRRAIDRPVPGADETERRMRAHPGEQARSASSSASCVGPDDVLVPDIDAKAEGRGVWITPRRGCGGRGGQEEGLRARASRRR